ncbi:MAG: adenylate/guanylate cyclase domain-containing protein [Defluviitaleaceae bacterium]|nr:adenylate/guanylate cyclase domain-containing protein [Defluviitaleaceae bacterium]
MYSRLKYLIPVLLLASFALIQFFDAFPMIDNLVYDNIMISEQRPMENIIIVGIDERSINEIGVWPWPRFFMAEAIDILTELEVAAIGINVLYDQHGLNEEHDQALIDAASRTDRLVLGGMGIFSDTPHADMLYAEDYVMPFEELNRVTNVGFLNLYPDASDAVLRRALTVFRFGDVTMYSLPFEVYRTYALAMGREPNMNIPFDRYGQFPVQFVGGPGSFNTLSFWGVLNGYYNPELFRDAIVLIGPYTHGVGTGNHMTPFERGSATFGIELYANIVQNLIQETFKSFAPQWLNLALLLAVGLIGIVIQAKFKPIPGLILTATLIILQLVGARLFFDIADTIIMVGNGILFLIFAYVFNLAIGFLAAQNEKQHVQAAFGRFVAPEVVKEIMSGGLDIQLGGVVKEISVVFVDIRGFTSFSEANPPEKVVEMVNTYLGLTSKSIQDNSGTIDKYIGDATMALFNAPNDVPDHALCAVKAAWDMKKGATALRDMMLENFGVDLQFGVGINTGKAVVGNMGSEFRMDYTAIGDTVNTAARLESNSVKGQIIISDATYQQVKDHVDVADLGVMQLKNKAEGIQVYSLEGVRGYV